MISLRKIDYERDIGEVVQLLRGSLSDNHSEEFFRWKHCENPFGQSYGLLACDGDKIVGARMFMFWEFRKADKIVKAIRPVDTIVHPSYRGKGLFKKLTLKGLESCRNTYDIVFNTPNENSLPGYLKMGWDYYPQKLDYRVAFLLPILRAWKVEILGVNDFDVPSNYQSSDSFRTHLTSGFLKWRYPGAAYVWATVDGSRGRTMVIFREEKIKGLKTLVILEIISPPGEDKEKLIRSLGSQLHGWVIYYLNDGEVGNPVFSFKSSSSRVVYRNDNFGILEDLKFSAGDLEGKL